MELYEKIKKLKDDLEKEKSIIEIKEIQNRILLDKELLNNIYKNCYDKNNDLIRKYRHLENEVNYIVLKINMNLKELVGGGICEGHTR